MSKSVRLTSKEVKIFLLGMLPINPGQSSIGGKILPMGEWI